MEKVTAAKAKQNFGELLDKAQRGPVEITKHGRRVGVLVSDEWYRFDQFLKQQDLEKRLQKSLQQVENGELIPAEQVFENMQERIRQWSKDAQYSEK